MSEPVTHAEIEDVLSSIRRLVSETGRGEGERTAPRPTAQAKTRLVLTPALRVPDATVAAQPAASIPESTPQSSPETNEHDATAAPEARALELPEVAPAPVADIAAELTARLKQRSEAQSAPVTPAVAPPVDEPTSQSEAVVDAVQDTPTEAPWRDPHATLYDAMSGVTRAPQGDSVLAEGGNSSARDVAENVDLARPQRQTSARVAAVVRQIAEIETKARGDEGMPGSLAGAVPDLNEDDIDAVPPVVGPAVDTLQWEDHVEELTEELEAIGAFAVEEEDEAPVESLRRVTQTSAEEATIEALAGRAEDFLDEASLRELVADIVREELQGALGERITRNVRKLVRREIQRALTAQDLL
ncbi:hypothetical protein [Arenibacterium sp. LLYu02]|uniref:hypothetical protein n=1 Tax=Arenibacterium sp. LLYu02 TaxID=3404132 RepID=UPI003B2122DA